VGRGVSYLRWRTFTRHCGPSLGLARAFVSIFSASRKTSTLPSIQQVREAAGELSPAPEYLHHKHQLTLHKSRQHLAPRLQQRVSHHDLHEPLQPLSPVLDHIVAEAIRKDLSGQGWDRDPRALPLKYVTEVFKVRVAAAHAGLPQFEGGDVGLAEDLVVRVHGAADTVRAWVLDLAERVWLEGGCLSKRKQGEQEGM